MPASAPRTPADARIVCSTIGLPAALAAEAELRLARDPVASIATLGLLPERILVVAKPAWDTPLAARRRGGAIGRALVAERAASASLDAAGIPGDRVEAFLLGATQGCYAFDRYQAKPAVRPTRLHVSGLTAAALAPIQATAEALADCRDLVNTPAQDCGPDEVEAAARALVRSHRRLRLRVLDERACAKLGMGCLLAVGRASHRRPRMLVLELPGTGAPLALCGKGVCFDTGGLNIKTGNSMLLMRKDMGGAATVLAAMAILAATGCRRRVRAYLPLVENALGPDAFRPGDVLTAMDGTTVEVGNTDAEGRLILADAIALARREQASAIVTVATLTGAAMIALGRIHVPLMGDDAPCAAIAAAAAATGEKAWRLPLDDEHAAIMRGTTTTLNNDGNGEAGCITAGAFLKHFAGPVPFAHLDISPASWMAKPHDLGPAGATAVMATTLAAAARTWP